MDMLDLLDSGNYITLNKDLIKKIGLNEAIILGELAGKYRYWKSAGRLDDKNRFFIKREDIEEETGLSAHLQRKAEANLINLGIVKIEPAESMNRSNYYKLFPEAIVNAVNDAASTPLTLERQPGERCSVNPVNTTKTSDTKTSDTKTSDILSAEEKLMVDEIVVYLNMATNKNYSSHSNNTIKFIKARFNEGYTVSDFKTVINNKTAQWLNDTNMNQYLRPATLFGNKFESYLNATPVVKQSDVTCRRYDPKVDGELSDKVY